jgi:hypothetical protein
MDVESCLGISINGEIGITLQGRYKTAVVDGVNGVEVWRQPEWSKNLILNQGLDALATMTIANSFEYGVAGTGIRFNSVLGGDSSGSCINGYFYLTPVGAGIQDLNATTYGGWVGGVLSGGDVIKFADNTEVTVVTPGAISASISSTTTVQSQSFTIWKTSQTGLQTEVKRAGAGRFGTVTGTSYFTTDNGCYAVTSSVNVVTYQRTYDFAIETTTRNYTEVGVAWDTDNSPSTSTFARMLLPVAVQVSGSQRLRLIYNLKVAFSPESASYVSNPPISGWPVSPAATTDITQSIQAMIGSVKFFSYLNNDATSISDFATLEPSTSGFYCSFWGSTNSQSLIQLGSGSVISRATTAYETSSTKETYTAGSYRMVKYATWPRWVLNHTDLNTFGFGVTFSGLVSYATSGQAFAIRFNQSQSKFSTEELTMKYLWTWNRVLEN